MVSKLLATVYTKKLKIHYEMQHQLTMAISLTHPRLLYPLCLAEVGERFSFHAMRSILVFYMTKVFQFSNQHAYEVFAAFTALLYFTPLIGGYLADKFISPKSGLILGGVLLSCGYFILAFAESNFYLGLSVIAVGSGFFMPNIASCVGELYQKNNSLRESGFSFFYTSLNIGAFLPPFITAGIIARFGWQAAFLVSACAALLSTFLLFFVMKKNSASERKILLFVFFIIVIMLFVFLKLIKHYHIASLIILSSSILIFIYALIKCFTYAPLERNRLLVCFALTAFSIIFWVLSEQTALSLATFTEYNVHRELNHYTIPTIFFFSLNPFFIITCGPIFSKLWVWLDTKNLNPSIPTKFALGTILMGIGFAVLPLGIFFQNLSNQINLGWLILSYLLQSCGELLLSPIGLAMMTELAPKKMWGANDWYMVFSNSDCLFTSRFCSKNNNPLFRQ